MIGIKGHLKMTVLNLFKEVDKQIVELEARKEKEKI